MKHIKSVLEIVILSKFDERLLIRKQTKTDLFRQSILLSIRCSPFKYLQFMRER